MSPNSNVGGNASRGAKIRSGTKVQGNVTGEVTGERQMIAHPERLIEAESQIAAAFRLCQEERIPPVIQALVLVGALRYGLRAVYGDDLRAGCALIREVIDEWRDVHVGACVRRIRYAVPWLSSWAWDHAPPSLRDRVGRIRCRVDPIRCNCGWAGTRRAALTEGMRLLCPECAQELRGRAWGRPHDGPATGC